MGGLGDLVGEATELVLHKRQRVVAETALAESAVGDERGDTSARLGRIAGRHQPRRCRFGCKSGRLALEAEVGGADDLALAERDAAHELGQVLAERRRGDECLDLPQTIRRGEAIGPGAHLAQRRHICGDPGEAVGGELVAFKEGGVNRSAGSHPRRQRAPRRRFVALGGGECKREVICAADVLSRAGHALGHDLPFLPLSASE